MLFKNFNHLWITKKIQLSDVPAPFSCDHCVSCDLNCFVMDLWSKCDKCTHHGCSCVNVLWKSLNKTCLSLHKEISKANGELATKHTELAVLSFRVVCLQKMLNLTDHCVSAKTDCLVVELDSDNNETENENNSFNMQQFVNSMSSTFWDSILFSS